MELEEGSGTPLEKQRRFLILMSMAVFARYALGVNVRAEGEYSGFMVKLSHPDRAVVGLWVVWGWAVLRYLQRTYELLSVLGSDVLEDVYAEDRRLALRKALRLAKWMARSGEIGDGRPNVRVTSVSIETGGGTIRLGRGMEEGREVQTEVRPDFLPTEEGGRKYEGLNGTYSWDGEGGHGASTFTFQMVLSRCQLRWHRIHAWLQGILRLPAVTEHIAPLLIAVGALISPQLFPGALAQSSVATPTLRTTVPQRENRPPDRASSPGISPANTPKDEARSK